MLFSETEAIGFLREIIECAIGGVNYFRCLSWIRSVGREWIRIMRGVSSGKVVAKQENSVVISCGYTCNENPQSSCRLCSSERGVSFGNHEFRIASLIQFGLYLASTRKAKTLALRNGYASSVQDRYGTLRRHHSQHPDILQAFA
jgi:hypothetical protein